MSNRLKFILLGMILANVNALAELPSFTDKENSEHYLTGKTEVFVSGIDSVEVDWNTYEIDKNGDTPQKTAFWAENGSTITNSGNISSTNFESDSKFISVAIGGIDNNLKRIDTLINLDSSTLNNRENGTISSGGLLHYLSSNGIGLGGSITGGYANYKKNIVSASNSKVINSGNITDSGDRIEGLNVVEVGILKYAEAQYEKNILNMIGGSVENNISGKIEAGRDINPKMTKIIDAEVANLGIRYYRNTSAIKSTGTNITNNGTIFVGGDLFEAGDNNIDTGVGLDLLGADFIGEHKKYGVNLTNGTLLNTGIIEVERDYTKAKLKDGDIVELKLIGNGAVLDLGLLSFSHMDEYSIGVNLENSTLENNNGTIKVGANSKGNTLDTSSTGAIAIIGNNNSQINFTGNSIIDLEGANVYVSSLTKNSTVTFDGITNIDVNNGTKSDKINKKLLKADADSKHIIKGTIDINGSFDNIDGNIEISSGSSVGGQVLGKIIVQDKFLFNEDIKINTSNMIGLSQKELTKFSNQSLIVAENGISGNGKFVSNSFLFDITTEKENETPKLTKDINNLEEIKIGSIKRRDFNQIVDNSSLGNLLENSYENFTSEQEKIYEQLASANNEQEFLQQIDEITGRKNVNTLSAQVYDITKDLTDNYKNLIKENREDGISFKYINSDSKFSNTNIAEGFERDSHGITVNFNKNINEKLRTGLGFSYLKSNVDYSPSASSNKIETWNIRGYLDRDIRNINLLTDFSFGYNDINNNRIFAGTLNKGEVKIYSFALNNSLYKEFSINEKLSIVPSLNLDLTYLLQDDYKEDKGVEFGETANYFVRGGINLSGVYNLFSNENHKINLKANLKYSHDFNGDVEEVEGKIYGFNDWVEYESRKIDKDAISYSIGLNYEQKDIYSLGIKYTKELINDIDNNQIGIDITYKF